MKKKEIDTTYDSNWASQVGLLLLLSHISPVWLLATPWTAAYQAPPSMGFSRQEYWSGLPLPSPQVGLVVNNLTGYTVYIRDSNFWVGKMPWRRKWQPTPVFLPGESHEQRIPWNGLWSTGLQKVGNNWNNLAGTHDSNNRHFSIDNSSRMLISRETHDTFFYMMVVIPSKSRHLDVITVNIFAL